MVVGQVRQPRKEIFSGLGQLRVTPFTVSYSQCGLRLNTNGNGYERPWQSGTLVMKQSNKCTGGCATPPPTIGALSARYEIPNSNRKCGLLAWKMN